MKSPSLKRKAVILLLTAVLGGLHSRATSQRAADHEDCGDVCRFLAEEAARECSRPEPVPAGILEPR